MDTKSEEGDPGSVDPTPLSGEERALLDRLRDGAGGPPPDGPAVTAEPAPPPGDTRPDPLDPVFREPTP